MLFALVDRIATRIVKTINALYLRYFGSFIWLVPVEFKNCTPASPDGFLHPASQSHLTGISHLSNMSHPRMAGTRSLSTETAPASVNHVRANAGFAAPPKPQPASTSTSQPATTQAPAKKQGKRSQLKSKAKKAFTSVKKSLKTVSAICFPKDLHSTTSSVRSRDSIQAQVRISLISRTSTPSICLTRPTYRGSNVRLSLHQVAPSRETSQPTCDVEPSQSGDGRTNSKNTRFQHPAVSRVITNNCVSDEVPTPNIAESSLNAGNTRPGAASTVGTIDFRNQVNPKRIFKNSQTTSGTGGFETFKNVMDGVRTKSPPRVAAEAQIPLPATAPSLPYLAMAPAMVMEVGAGTPRPELAAQSTEHEVLATSSYMPSTLAIPSILAPGSKNPMVVPSILAPGSKQPVAKPRARPHTTLPGTNYLPYVPYNPRFNPYGATSPVTNRPVPIPTCQQKPSAEDLAAVFAEAEAAEQAAIRQRHTTLYAAVESGSLTSLIATTSVATATVTSTTAVTAATSKAPSSDAFTIKRKPVPKRPEAPKPRAAKPLPPLPTPSSSRRFTYGIVTVRSDRDGLPSQQVKLSPAPQIARWRRK